MHVQMHIKFDIETNLRLVQLQQSVRVTHKQSAKFKLLKIKLKHIN